MAVKKVSVTLDAELLAQARQQSDNLSALLNDALAAYIRNVNLGRLLDELDEEFGPVPEETMREAREEMDAAILQVERGRRALRQRGPAPHPG